MLYLFSRLSMMLVLVGLVLAGLVVAGAIVVQSSLPVTRGQVTVEGLGQTVLISRDRYGVPLIEAADEQDAYFAIGFLHAQDRLWQMEMQRRLASGRLAEIFGSVALPFDRFMRLMRFQSLVESSFAAMRDDSRRLLEAYAAGVNAFLTTNRRPLPPEFQIFWHEPEPWQPTDSLLWAKIMALDLSGNWRGELLRTRLAERLTPEQLAALWPGSESEAPVSLHALVDHLSEIDLAGLAAVAPPEPPPGMGSNAWAVSGKHTSTGKPILANDPHLGLTSPSVWYLVRAQTQSWSAAGATLPGMPVLVLGQNEAIAWGMTTTGSDVQDLFIEQFDEDDPDRYRTPDGWSEVDRMEETIVVRFGEDQSFVNRWTRHGPILSDIVESAETGDPTTGIALAWSALQPDDVTLEAGFDLARARDWQTFNKALEAFTTPQQNLFYADREGHIGLVAPGRVPIRKKGQGWLPVPGWDGEHDWTGWIPFEDLPRIFDPPRGRIVNANNRLVGDDYPFFLTGDWSPPHRARRIEDQLDEIGAASDVTVPTMADLQFDRFSGLAEIMMPFFLEIEPRSPKLKEILNQMRAWDRVMAVNAWQPILFRAWYRSLAPLLYADELGPYFRDYVRTRSLFVTLALSDRQVWCDNVGTAPIESCHDIIEAALQTAVDQLEADLGTDRETWRLGAVQTARFQHRPFSQLGSFLVEWFELSVPVGGDETSVNVSSTQGVRSEPPFFVSHGASYRAIMDMGAPLNGDGETAGSRYVLAGGQSGHPRSRWRSDQLALWAVGATMSMGSENDVSGGSLRLNPDRQ
ncbi:MAG: penicillin acylase family protein [Geminicoccaceae bacterium]